MQHHRESVGLGRFMRTPTHEGSLPSPGDPRL